jgi:hypothetical protein
VDVSTRDRTTISPDVAHATLTGLHATSRVRLVEPASARFEVIDTNATPSEKQQFDARILAVWLHAVDRPARMVVRFGTDPGLPADVCLIVEPLDRWVTRPTFRS